MKDCQMQKQGENTQLITMIVDGQEKKFKLTHIFTIKKRVKRTLKFFGFRSGVNSIIKIK